MKSRRQRFFDILPLFYAILTRLMFIIHGVMCVWLLSCNYNNSNYWWLIIGILCLLVEMCYTLAARKGREYKYFWPSCLFYMLTMVPIVWILETDLHKTRSLAAAGTTQAPSSVTAQPQTTDTKGSCIPMDANTMARKLCELGLIIMIILGRWLLPRGEITRDQLSALLLGYVGTAADILELFEVFEEPQVGSELQITTAVLGVYSWSLLQFTLVTTATTGKDNKIRIASNKVDAEKVDKAIDRKISLHKHSNYNNEDELKEKYIQRLRIKRRQTEKDLTRGKGFKGVRARKVNPITHARGEVKEISRREMLLHGDIFGILTGIFMQDGPFLVLRLVLIIKYNLYSEMHLFFTCKNAIALSLLMYRLCILTCSGEDEEFDENRERESRLQNVQQAVHSDQFKASGAIQLAG
ncbi:transmembrane protein 26 [Nematostella vectensis]|uniref:transmembrane protein 26 n=1 Tax=Nematostella vectensis TaxID=45351 RepID=UPI00207749E5|nr:transmembrane protein 26 [Nematostella vectensis]